MKKRWFLASLFALALCAGAASAQAAVVSGGVEYVWYTDMGRGYANENNQFVSNEGQQLYLSADQGGSYAVLPGLGETQKKTGLAYVISVLPNAANDGGLSVKARDTWSSEYTWFRDYSAQEIAAALKNAVAIPVEVFATNGTVTVGTRYVQDWSNDDPTKPHYDGGNQSIGGYNGDRIVYSTDGVTWLPTDQEKEEYYSSIGSGWWDGNAFHAGDYVSADGIHWVKTEEKQVDPTFSLACELGPYRFEYAENADGEWGVYLMDRTSPDTGVLLPHMGEAAREKWVSIGKLRAWYGPNDTVILAAYDVYGKEKHMVSIDYPISSLDWCLENLKTQFRYLSAQADKWEDDEHIGLALVERNMAGIYERELLRCGDGWQWAAPPFRNVQRIYPYNGKTFVARADGKLYASEDGLSWECLEGRGLGEEWDWREYSFVWAGDRYISCRRTVEYSSGRAGTWGKKYDPACTRVSFLNEKFEIIGSYDFGRQVKAVGYLDGTCYAQVSDSAGVSTVDYRKDVSSTLYRSADGRSWEKLPDIYVSADDIMVSTQPKWESELRVTGTEEKPVCSVAQLDRWRFVLNEYFAWDDEKNVREDHPTYRVCLMGDSAADWVELPHLGEAIKAQNVDPRELLAAYNPDGTVEVKVTDINDPAKYISISYPTSSLDWVKENLMGINGRELPQYLGTNNDAWDIVSKYGVADLIAVELANGESEIVYRSEATGGQWKWCDSAPWGNDPKLLPFSGKDFMVYENGSLFRSSDGVNWSKAESEWIDRGGRKESTAPPGHPLQNWRSDPAYRFLWTGTGYLASCYQTFGLRFAAYTPSKDAGKVAFLDDDLKLLFTHDFGHVVQRIGCRDGVYYAQTDVWDLQFEPPRWDEGAEDTLWRSTDGVNWEKTDVLQVHDMLVELQ